MADGNTRSKVVRLIEKYELEGVGDELEERWTRSTDRDGIRQLAGYLNRRLLGAAFSAADADPLDGEIENAYRLLVDEDISSGVRTETRNQLAADGIDVEQLERDFVSKQAIHTYLTKVRGVTPPERSAPSAEKREDRNETIQRLKQRLATVTERTLTNLRNTERLTLGEFNVLVNVRVHCMDCETQVTVTELLATGSCECGSAGD